MPHATICTYFYVALGGGLPLGLLLMILWARKILKPLTRSIENEGRIHLHAISMRGTIYMLPGIAAMIVCAVPAFYYNHLLKQHDYCVGVVRVNKGISKNDPFLKQRCGRYDFSELVALSQQPR